MLRALLLQSLPFLWPRTDPLAVQWTVQGTRILARWSFPECFIS